MLLEFILLITSFNVYGDGYAKFNTKYKLTNSMKKGPSPEADIRSAGKEISHLFIEPEGSITEFTITRLWTLSQATRIQSTYSYPIYLRPILILSSRKVTQVVSPLQCLRL
jgi:hypothetical protein